MGRPMGTNEESDFRIERNALAELWRTQLNISCNCNINLRDEYVPCHRGAGLLFYAHARCVHKVEAF